MKAPCLALTGFLLALLVSCDGSASSGSENPAPTNEVIFFTWMNAPDAAFSEGVEDEASRLDAEGAHSRYFQLYRDVVQAFGVDHPRTRIVEQAFKRKTGTDLAQAMKGASSSRKIETH